MGERFPILWFCKDKSVTEIKAILETKKDLTAEERAELEKLINEKEKESE